MTLTCDLELAWLTWVLHINSLRRTFDQSLMKIFQKVQRYGADKKVLGKDRQMDGQTKAISIIPHLLRGGGLISCKI